MTAAVLTSLILYNPTISSAASRCIDIASSLSQPNVSAELFDMSLKGFAFFKKDSALMNSRKELVDKIIDGERNSELEKKYWQELVAAATTPFLKNYLKIFSERPDWQRLPNFINRGQMSSKHWLIDRMEQAKEKIFSHLKRRDGGTTLVVGGWFGALPELLINRGSFPVKKYVTIDLDPEATRVAVQLHKENIAIDYVQAATADAMQIDYAKVQVETLQPEGNLSPLEFSPDIIINTSVEHFPDFKSWYEKVPRGKVVVLQSNDYFAEPEHCNCSTSLDEFSKKVPMSQVFIKEQIPVYSDLAETKIKYNRFLLIGVK